MLTFKEFKSKLEDECLRVINTTNYKIGQPYLARPEMKICPLGTRLIRSSDVNDGYFPCSTKSASIWKISQDQALSFISGYSGYGASQYDMRYYNLGQAYRKKFG